MERKPQRAADYSASFAAGLAIAFDIVGKAHDAETDKARKAALYDASQQIWAIVQGRMNASAVPPPPEPTTVRNPGTAL